MNPYEVRWFGVGKGLTKQVLTEKVSEYGEIEPE